MECGAVAQIWYFHSASLFVDNINTVPVEYSSCEEFIWQGLRLISNLVKQNKYLHCWNIDILHAMIRKHLFQVDSNEQRLQSMHDWWNKCKRVESTYGYRWHFNATEFRGQLNKCILWICSKKKQNNKNNYSIMIKTK